jgi:hypothetical protein
MFANSSNIFDERPKDEILMKLNFVFFWSSWAKRMAYLERNSSSNEQLYTSKKIFSPFLHEKVPVI